MNGWTTWTAELAAQWMSTWTSLPSMLRVLLIATLISTALAVVLGAVLKVARVRHPALQHRAWLGLALGMLLLPLSLAMEPWWHVVLPPELAPLSPLPQSSPVTESAELPASPAPPVAESAAIGEPAPAPWVGGPAVMAPGPSGTSSWQGLGPADAQAGRDAMSRNSATPWWGTWLLGFYGLGVLILSLRLWVGWRLSRQLIARSSPLEMSRRAAQGTLDGVAMCREILGQGRAERLQVRRSDDLASPVCVGGVRPVILMPRHWDAWDATTRQAVLAHELHHLRRRDFAAHVVVLITRCVYWFHPLAWWMTSHVAQLAERSCDVQAAPYADSPQNYARLLLQLAEDLRLRGPGVVPLALAMSGYRKLNLRVRGVLDRRAVSATAGPVASVAWAGGLVCATLLFGLVELGAPLAAQAPDVALRAEPVNSTVDLVEQPDAVALDVDLPAAGVSAADVLVADVPGIEAPGSELGSDLTAGPLMPPILDLEMPPSEMPSSEMLSEIAETVAGPAPAVAVPDVVPDVVPGVPLNVLLDVGGPQPGIDRGLEAEVGASGPAVDSLDGFDATPVVDLRAQPVTTVVSLQPSAVAAMPLSYPFALPREGQCEGTSESSDDDAGFLVLLFDDKNRAVRSRPRVDMDAPVQAELVQWLEHRLSPCDRVAVLSYQGRLRLHQDFTRDASVLLQAVDEAQKGKLKVTEGPAGTEGVLLRDALAPQALERRLSVYKALEELAAASGDLPGPTTVVMVTPGFDENNHFSDEFNSPARRNRLEQRLRKPINAFVEADTVVHVVNPWPMRNRYGVRLLTEKTGGWYVFGFKAPTEGGVFTLK